MNPDISVLNPKQQEAVLSLDGPLLVLAGAGSGKTRVIVYRIAHLVEAMGISPSAILAVTFTNKAAAEMKERVQRLLPKQHGFCISTFHAACLQILRAHIHHLGYRNTFAVYDTQDSVALIRICLEELSVSTELHPPRALAARLSALKTRLITPDAYALTETRRFGPDAILAKVYALYQEKLRVLHGVDFDDLIGLTVALLDAQPDIKDHYHARWRYILVDEYQDTNAAQYRLIRLLTSSKHNLCVVGDDDQSIYAFRGADVNNILEFERDFPDARVVVLDQNYRSTRSILDAASTVIARNDRRKPKALWTQNEVGGPVIWQQVADEEAEGQWLCQTIGALQSELSRPLSSFCVLYRTNAQSRTLEDALRKAQIPYRIIGGLRFYDRKEIKDLLAYLRLLICPDDDISFRRVINLPSRGIGAVTLDRLTAYAGRSCLPLYRALAVAFQKQEALEEAWPMIKNTRAIYLFMEEMRATLTLAATAGKTPHLLERLIEQIGYFDYLKREDAAVAENRIENVIELISAAAAFEERFTQENGWDYTRGLILSAFLDQAVLMTSADDPQKSGVVLMTLHAAKGLEFPVVFLVGMEEGLFPHSRALANAKEMEEERRLCYVGMTRACERLFLVSAKERKYHGALHFNVPSRFIDEIEGKCQPRREMAGNKNGIAPWRPPIAKAGIETYAIGTMVSHPTLGMGQIRHYEGHGETLKVSVAFSNGTKILMVRQARLKRAQ